LTFAEEPIMDASLIAFIEAAQAAHPDEPIPTHIERVWHIGGDQETALIVADLIKQGEKTGTFQLPDVYTKKPQSAQPLEGNYGIVTDLNGAPKVMIKTVATRDVRYGDITEADVQIDGPAMRELNAWQDVHWAHFGNLLKQVSKPMTEDVTVTIEDWALVHAED